MDVDRTPIEGVPNLAIEVISPGNSAQDMLTKVHQYLEAGCRAVWVVYPSLTVVEIHDSRGTREIAAATSLQEAELFGGHAYLLPLSPIFEEDITK